MQKKSRRPWEKVLSMALMLVMLMLGILCFLTPLSTLVGVQYLAFGCLAIYSVVMVVRYIGSEHKSKFLLLGGVACFCSVRRCYWCGCSSPPKRRRE